MMITLYHYGNSVCAEKARLALNEKGLHWKSQEVNLMRGEQLSPEYLRLNSKGVVPTLVVDGKPLVESTLIVEFLDDAFPEPPLKPADPFERAAVRLFAKMCDEGLHQGIAVISSAAVFMDRMRANPAGAMASITRIIDPDRRERQTAVHDHGIEAPHVYRGIAAFEKAFKKIDATLGDGRDWLWQGGFSIAEINLAPYVARLDYLGLLPIWTKDRPAVTAWFDRVKTRRSFQEEVAHWIRPDELDDMLSGGARVRARIDELRADYLAKDPGAGYF